MEGRAVPGYEGLRNSEGRVSRVGRGHLKNAGDSAPGLFSCPCRVQPGDGVIESGTKSHNGESRDETMSKRLRPAAAKTRQHRFVLATNCDRDGTKLRTW